MGDLKNMRKKIYCSGWGAISEPVSELSSVGARHSRDSVLSPLNVRVPTETVVLKVCPVV
ncbi:hypothetical protein LEP1GSC016_1549 [Leptospira borgpetersenii serovar Hardjo-bovis str. Sponselee]|uniref:Uncharacterized protein n=1 Tax=Leptospira borgpetersenii serovar Hardjo-bovis str. Sponselee TaxID=1303729 RepID=M6C429_LEPBO|nr:hypothetical protein LEP1GSC016_1549 [Leptospira borgpetersenii serovar Hardjo-bovis str. Sponselee]